MVRHAKEQGEGEGQGEHSNKGKARRGEEGGKVNIPTRAKPHVCHTNHRMLQLTLSVLPGPCLHDRGRGRGLGPHCRGSPACLP